MKTPAIRGKRIVALWAAMAILVFLFPHYVVKQRAGVYLDAGWGFLFVGPATKGHDDWQTRNLAEDMRTRLKLPRSVSEEVVWDSARKWVRTRASDGGLTSRFLALSDPQADSVIKKAVMKKRKPDPRVTLVGGHYPESAAVDHRLLVLMQSVLAGIMAAWIFTDSRAAS